MVFSLEKIPVGIKFLVLKRTVCSYREHVRFKENWIFNYLFNPNIPGEQYNMFAIVRQRYIYTLLGSTHS